MLPHLQGTQLSSQLPNCLLLTDVGRNELLAEDDLRNLEI